jgi:uncharacterized membrane-anchored protein YhcB (DUF1043 family)
MGSQRYSLLRIRGILPALFFGRYEESSVESPEYSLNILIAAAVVSLIVGLGLGLLFGRRSSTSSQKYREVERKLDQVLQDKKAYEDDVVEHFTDTAKLLNNLTESYRDVHNHLARGASTLCQGEGPVSLDRLGDGGDTAEIPADLADVQPPLDYAPKTSPNEKGMLNEEFGLERKPVPPVPPVPAVPPVAADSEKA